MLGCASVSHNGQRLRGIHVPTAAPAQRRLSGIVPETTANDHPMSGAREKRNRAFCGEFNKVSQSLQARDQTRSAPHIVGQRDLGYAVQLPSEIALLLNSGGHGGTISLVSYHQTKAPALRGGQPCQFRSYLERKLQRGAAVRVGLRRPISKKRTDKLRMVNPRPQGCAHAPTLQASTFSASRSTICTRVISGLSSKAVSAALALLTRLLIVPTEQPQTLAASSCE